MEIVEYDDVDPVKAMYAPMLALDFPMTPERVAQIRQTDPRPFPCLGLYAVEDDQVLGQVGVFKLPMVSNAGREDVGGVWAVSTHPQHAGRGIASLLLEEAHVRMRRAGLRFSTLGTDRYRLAYKLYARHGYQETDTWGTALARWDAAHRPTRLRAQPPDPGGHDWIESIYVDIAEGYLGFAWRHIPFAPLRRLKLSELWVLHENTRTVGYAIAQVQGALLNISNVTLRQGIDIVEAVAALTAVLKADYVQVKVSRPVEMANLQHAGYHVAHPNWSSFMIKPLVAEVTFEDAVRLFGLGTDRFLISWLDTT
jgi:GNAT superfamily N-acetyltransferase